MRLIRLRGKTEMKRPENQTPTRGAGFTLIELMIVVAIIGILATIAIPKFAGLIRKSSEGQTKGNLGALRSVVSIYYGENETYPAPSASGDTSVASSMGQLLTMQNGKYIQKAPNCYNPPYHASNSAFVVTLSTVDESSYPGSWGYDASKADQGWGTVWVNCTHTDTNGKNWSTY